MWLVGALEHTRCTGCGLSRALYVVKQQTEEGEREVERWCQRCLPERWASQAALLRALPVRRYGKRRSFVGTTHSIMS